MLNYLARRVNPTPYCSLMPVEVVMFGEDQILEAFQRHPPDYFLLTNEGADVYECKPPQGPFEPMVHLPKGPHAKRFRQSLELGRAQVREWPGNQTPNNCEPVGINPAPV